jgi:hypothetical protein
MYINIICYYPAGVLFLSRHQEWLDAINDTSSGCISLINAINGIFVTIKMPKLEK